MHIHSLVRAALAACVLTAVAASPAIAAVTTTQLRVEAGGHDIGPGWRYAHDSVIYDTSQSAACNGSGESGEITGPSALGLLVQGSAYTRKLRPVQVSDQFDFGSFVCGVGQFSSSDSAFWLYKVDHVAPEVGADQFQVEDSHDQVLWYLSDTATGSNTGNELFLSLGARTAQVGAPLNVTVLEYDVNGESQPATGVRILGTDEVTDASGGATLTFDTPGRKYIRGVRPTDIPTDGERLCIWETSESECENFLAGRIIGTTRSDRLGGTDDPDYIAGRGGDDEIGSRGDDAADWVRCGKGDDVARIDELDRVARGCETVRRG